MLSSNNNSHSDSEHFWASASVDEWAKEMDGMRTIAENFANITDNSIVGIRAPYAGVGGNNQFTMMEGQDFLYDSAIKAPFAKVPFWPYTLHFRIPHRCQKLQNCPTRSSGIWEMVMNELDRRDDPSTDEILPGCILIDACVFSSGNMNI